MNSLFLLQFACLVFMLINAFTIGISHLHVKWENKRYERSRWMIFIAMIGTGCILRITTRLAIAFVTSSRGNVSIYICSSHPYSL